MGVKKTDIRGLASQVGVRVGDLVTSHWGHGSAPIYRVLAVHDQLQPSYRGHEMSLVAVKSGRSAIKRTGDMDVLIDGYEAS